MSITPLLASTTILNEGAITATATMPTIPAAVVGNRGVFVTFTMYNGAGTCSTPTAPVCNGVSPVFVCGDSVAQTRLASSTWMFKESDIASISGQTLTSTTGATGSQKSITVEVLDDVAQTVPTNVNSGYISASALITLPLTRVANSRTLARAFCSVSGVPITLTNPSRLGTNNFTARWLSYASAADTAQTIDYTCNGANFTTTHVFNVAPFPAGTINTVNGGTYNPVKAGSSGNTVTVTGFTPTSGTLGGKAISALTSTGGGGYTFTAAAYIDGGTYPEPDTTQVLILTDGSASPTANVTLSSPNGMSSVTVASPVTDDNRYVPYWMKLAGYEPVDGDRFGYTTADCVISADGGVSADNEVVTTVWLWQASGTILRSFTMTINEQGAVDIDPDAFTFGSVTGANLSTITVGSSQATISGVGSGVNIPAIPSGGLEFRISTDGGTSFGSWLNSTANIQLGYVLEGRVTSSASYNTLVTGSLTIGTTIGTLEVTTRLSDTAPDAFTFGSITKVTPTAIIASPLTVTVAGVDAGLDVATSASGGLEYRVDSGSGYGAWRTTSSNVRLGYNVQARLAAPSNIGDSATGMLTMGGVEGTFTVTAGRGSGSAATLSMTGLILEMF